MANTPKDISDKEFLENLGKRIAELRKEKGWTQKEFSEMLGMQRSALARIETGKVNISILSLSTISQKLDVSINDLV